MPKYAVTLDGYERYLQNLAKKWTNQKNKKYEMLHFGDLNKTHFIRFMRRDTIHFGQAACPLTILTKYGAKVFKMKQFSM